MATISSQRDLVATLKRETCLNVGILSKLHTMPAELSRQIFKDNCLEKPIQNMFNNLSYYLVCIIDPTASAGLPWPLYDTKTEKLYRTGFSNLLSSYSSKGLLSPVMSSYLVNPGCYKVTILIFQLSQLAVERVLTSKMNKDHQKSLYNEMTAKYKSHNKEGFIENIESETERMLSKFSNYLHKRNITEKIAEMLRKKITDIEDRLSSTNAQKLIDNLVDNFLKQYTVDDTTKTEILDIKNVNKAPHFFDEWLVKTDIHINELECEWERRISPFLEKSKETLTQTESLIARQTGEADKNTYMIEYNPTTDEISTENLQNEVNSEQKYILKNIVKNERLSFPNLIRGFLISLCYVLRGTEIGDDVYRFNEYLVGGRRNFNEIVTSMRILIERVMNAEARLQSTPILCHQSLSAKDYAEIPPLPDLSDLKANREMQCQVLFDTFTPLSTCKHKFNLRKRPQENSFVKPQPKSLLNMPYHGPKDDFFKSVISCRFSAYDRSNETQNFHDMSIISHAPSRVNETIAECSSGFTKQQILRLLSTKKSSSSKKFKYKTERPDNIKIKKGGLFNESINSNESNLCRSYSSPNLFENRDKRPHYKGGRRKLSIMQEDSPSLLEVSGIASLERDSNYGTPESVMESTRQLVDATSLPIISAMPSAEQKMNSILREFEDDLNKEISQDIESPTLLKEDTTIEQKDLGRIETPKMNAQLVSKTSSLEKIINRFKKVRANIIPMDKEDETNEFRTIVEEKENLNTVNVDVFTANKILLPDLLSPSCSTLTIKSTDYLDQLCFDIDDKERRKPRESLGTALGVDQTFLDQFDLID